MEENAPLPVWVSRGTFHTLVTWANPGRATQNPGCLDGPGSRIGRKEGKRKREKGTKKKRREKKRKKKFMFFLFSCSYCKIVFFQSW